MTTELEALRYQITEIDNEILEALESRMRLAEDIAEFKKENNMPIEDIQREEQIIKGRQLHTSLNEQFIENLFQLIFKESKRIQEEYDN